MTKLLLSRRALLGAAAAAAVVQAGPAPAQDAAVAAKIADHFSAIRTMTGDFVQFGPRGEQTGGKFFIQRPGKVRFNYEAPSAYRVISDGQAVVVDNRKLNTSDLYPLSKTPLKMLLSDRIDLSGSRLRGVEQDGDSVRIQIVDRSVFGNARLTMIFDSKSYDLRQWTITDAQGKDTTVLVDNVKTGVSVDPDLFKIDYKRYRELNRRDVQR
jgi:outer membrane lipoprotein-sorting protein